MCLVMEYQQDVEVWIGELNYKMTSKCEVLGRSALLKNTIKMWRFGLECSFIEDHQNLKVWVGALSYRTPSKC